MCDQIDVNGGAREQAGCRDQIALDDSRIPNSHLARGEGMGCEARPVTEETHLASPALLAQWSHLQSRRSGSCRICTASDAAIVQAINPRPRHVCDLQPTRKTRRWPPTADTVDRWATSRS